MATNGGIFIHMVFFGEYLVSFTAPGRIVLPKKIRSLVKGEDFILSKGFDHCLAGYDRSDWEQKTRDLTDVSLLDRENLATRRFVFSSAILAEIDDQGRFVIPKQMLNYASLDGKAVIVGVGDHFEIWQQEKWSSQLNEAGI